MVSLEWTKLNKRVKIFDTRKKYFRKYYASIKYFVVGGRIISPPGMDYDLDAAIRYRKGIEDRMYNYGGSWRGRAKDVLSNLDADQLEAFRRVKHNRSDLVFRTEEPYMTIYAESEQDLYELALHDFKNWHHNIIAVTRPASAEHRDLLDKGHIIMKKDLNYRYKVILKDGKISNKVALHNYLESIRDTVKVSKSVWNMLRNDHPWIWGVWFYINDPDLLTMFNIIEPGIISNIHELAVL